MTSSALDQLLDEIAQRVAVAVVERLRSGEPGMVDQAASPLGRRRHCSAVRQRLARGQPGAAVVGRRHLLSPEAIREELGQATKQRLSPPQRVSPSVRDELARELRLIKRA
jgi:hypothetical protein